MIMFALVPVYSSWLHQFVVSLSSAYVPDFVPVYISLLIGYIGYINWFMMLLSNAFQIVPDVYVSFYWLFS